MTASEVQKEVSILRVPHLIKGSSRVGKLVSSKTYVPVKREFDRAVTSDQVHKEKNEAESLESR